MGSISTPGGDAPVRIPGDELFGSLAARGRLRRVLVVDDDRALRERVAEGLRAEGMTARVADTGERALRVLREQPCDLLLCELALSDMSGLELIDLAIALPLRPVVVAMSGYGTTERALEAIQRGAHDFIGKPFELAELVLAIRKAEQRQRLRRAVGSSVRTRPEPGAHAAGDEVIAQSEAMRRVLETVEKVAAYKSTVLIQGESGTGKELVARAIHRCSPRRSGPFVPVNCGAIPEALLESELFGHRKGSFTGAMRDKPGLFSAAEAGTLFLDEIGELPQQLQVKLLRVLQEQEIRPVGQSQADKIDVRVVTATARDLQSELASGAFRRDLFYRLNVLPVVVPPLRERPEDIPPLVEHFMRRNAEQLKMAVGGVAPEAMRALTSYDWPGNVRELENTVEHAMVLADGPVIDVDSLPVRVRGGSDPVRRALTSGTLSIKKTSRLIEEELIRRALKQTGGNRTGASKILEISHRSLLYKIKEYGITDL